MKAALYRNALYEQLIISGVPDHLHNGIVAYVTQGIRTGAFLYAVLTNDLMQTIAMADEANLHKLREIVVCLYSNVPSTCYGSKEVVERWIKQGGLEVSLLTGEVEP